MNFVFLFTIAFLMFSAGEQKLNCSNLKDHAAIVKHLVRCKTML